MKITGLTQDQIDLLDKIWVCDTREEVDDFISSLPVGTRPIAHSLVRLIELEVIDDHVNNMDRFPLAEKVLERF